ncbi:ankyrin repeat domain-containing protein 37 isoform X2 [Marmota marmota marmota]|uniref:ankyrin repeat domain-containing protein 37 isoform X2 n=1 Tax=Marmota marmota marmota TaxID=9994 RepID=UPI002092F390|nr:ankyrin repeat domain-containing protein 37 isoform X2 [Marmota marmota marmota]
MHPRILGSSRLSTWLQVAALLTFFSGSCKQDVLGEAPLHKAAKVGSLECLSLLVASDAQIDLCNKNGQTAEDLAWSCGFPECAKFLTTIKCMQTIKSSEQSDGDHCVPVFRQKRSFGSTENTNGKRRC